MSLEMAHKVIVPQKKIISRSFLNSGTLIVILKRALAQWLSAEPEFLNFYEAQKSIPRNRFRQAVWPGGPVRQPYSHSVPSPHRLF